MHVNRSLKFGAVLYLASLTTALSGHASARAAVPASDQPPIPHKTRTILATVKVRPAGDLRYELSVAPCHQKACPFQVRLLQGKTALSTVDMDWVKASGTATEDAVDESSGVGDPLQPDTAQPSWSTGDEKEEVSTVAREVRLTSQLSGLLIDRRAGFDELKRHHDLFVAVNKKLVLAWSDADGPGPSSSTVVLSHPRKGNPQDILSFRGFRSPSDTEPDRLHLFTHRWDATKNKLVEPKVELELSAAIAGTYDNVSKARAARTAADCLGPLWVLPSDNFSKLAHGKFVLAAVTTRKDLADKKTEEVRSCAAQLSLSPITSPYHQRED